MMLEKDYEGKYHVTPITTNLEEYYTKLNALVASNETPDCFIVSPGPNLDTYVEPGVAADLTDALKADGWLDTFNGGEGAFSQQTYDGKIYAVPLNIAAACVFYNTEMFEKAGISTMPTDWNGMLDACEKLQAAGDTNDVATANFYNEEAAMLIQGSWAIAQINGSNPDFEDKCGVFAFPGTDGNNVWK